MTKLSDLSNLLKKSNDQGREISKLIGNKPMHTGRIGEFIAANIFKIKLHPNARTEGSDGIFRNFPPCKNTVNIKWYTRRESILSMKKDGVEPSYYLVMTGPEKRCKEISRPLVIRSVFLFNTEELRKDLKVEIKRNATSINKGLWEKARIYPANTNKTLILTSEEKGKLEMFCQI